MGPRVTDVVLSGVRSRSFQRAGFHDPYSIGYSSQTPQPLALGGSFKLK